MRLDMDCVRSILLCVEKNTDLRHACRFVDCNFPEIDEFLDRETEVPHYQTELQSEFDNESIVYHARYCIDAGLLYGSDRTSGNEIWVADLTPKGHEFLANIRSNSNWVKTKRIAMNVGSTSLGLLMQIASGVLGDAASKQFGIT